MVEKKSSLIDFLIESLTLVGMIKPINSEQHWTHEMFCPNIIRGVYKVIVIQFIKSFFYIFFYGVKEEANGRENITKLGNNIEKKNVKSKLE